MRWFLWLVLVVALVTGVLYGVGRFLLPNELSVTSTATIDRPRAAVFAMSNDLRIAREWSPYYAMDPDAEYRFSGENPGAGQTMRWSSTVRQVGSGRISIVESIENEQIDTIVEVGERATMNAQMLFRAVDRTSTSVAWTITAQCSEGWINVPCRYMNLILRGVAARDMASGLARLKTLSEQLPDVDFENLNPQFNSVEPQMFVYSVVETSANDQGEVDRAEAMGLNQVRQFMSEYQLVAAGPLVRVVTDYNSSDNRMSFRVGYPYQGATPLTVVGVQLGQTPSGDAMHVLVEGTRAQVRAAYLQMNAYLQAHRIPLREGGLPWEVVHQQGSADGAVPSRIEIFMPLQ